nr:protein kinase-like domain, phloem protein 2-like protein [Tanacetum cinerariifolium]
MTELEILMEYKYEHVIGLVGYCDEDDEKIIFYEYALRGSLDKYLSDNSLTDINSSNILLFDDWKAKISDFGLSLVCPTNHDVDYVIDNVTGTIGYCDPLSLKTGFLTKESDIFSLGAVLFDILCGKVSSVKLDDERERRPTAHEVVIQLNKSLEFQEDYENWEPKLPKDYKEIIQMSKCLEIYSTIKKEDLYNILSTRVLLQQDKVLLSFDGNRERNKMVSATTFSYINSCPLKWQSLP